MQFLDASVAYLKDSLVNLVSGLGTDRAKSSASTYAITAGMPTTEAVAFYRSSWLAKKIVNIPAQDMFRKWRAWQASEEQITAIEAEEKRLNLRNKYVDAKVKSRLYGESAIYIGTGDKDLELPLDLTKIGKGGIRFLNVFSVPDDLAPEAIIRDPESPYFNESEFYQMVRPGEGAAQVRVHRSRIILFVDEPVPDDRFMATRSGMRRGDGVLMARKQAILNAETTAQNIAELIFEAKIDIFRLPNFMSSISSKPYRDKVTERFGLAATMKGITGALVMDKEEEYESKTHQFSSLADLMDKFSSQASGAADIPITRLYGTSPGGLNATGESDLRNYYDGISSDQELEITPVTQPLDDAIIISALGFRPPKIHYIWNSLWQISDKERSEIGKQNADMIKTLNDTGLFPEEGLANAAINLLVENSIMPGLDKTIQEAGGLPDYDLEAEIEQQEMQRIATAANSNSPREGNARAAVNDAPPGPRTLYVRRDVLNGAAIAAHYKAQGLTIMPVEKLHVTIIHSSQPVDWFETGEPWASKLTITAGGARANALFGPPGIEDTLVLMIQARELAWRHEAFKAAGAESTYDKYHPHVSLVYMKQGERVDNWEELTPYQGEIELGPEIYEEVKVKPHG